MSTSEYSSKGSASGSSKSLSWSLLSHESSESRSVHSSSPVKSMIVLGGLLKTRQACWYASARWKGSISSLLERFASMGVFGISASASKMEPKSIFVHSNSGAQDAAREKSGSSTGGVDRSMNSRGLKWLVRVKSMSSCRFP